MRMITKIIDKGMGEGEWKRDNRGEGADDAM
jgi:hypothetical protein